MPASRVQGYPLMAAVELRHRMRVRVELVVQTQATVGVPQASMLRAEVGRRKITGAVVAEARLQTRVLDVNFHPATRGPKQLVHLRAKAMPHAEAEPPLV